MGGLPVTRKARVLLEFDLGSKWKFGPRTLLLGPGRSRISPLPWAKGHFCRS